MRCFINFCLALVSLIAAPCLAQERMGYESVVTEVATASAASSDERGTPAPDTAGDNERGNGRFVPTVMGDLPSGIARFGPFRVLDSGHAALVDVTDGRSPAAFARMMAAYPGIAEIVMIECPGTVDDGANLRLGRMIRARGLATWVPDGGSVRSGAVELFLAGIRHRASKGAEFAVHAWADDNGHQPSDFAPDAPANRAYIDYYREMGMTVSEARAFYDMTNAVPNTDARWLTAAQMAMWVRID